MPQASVLRFKMTATGKPLDVMRRYSVKGQTTLNSKEWRGKEPRTCAVSNIHTNGNPMGEGESVYDVEVTYKPKGHVTFLGETKYDGWTLMMLDRKNDGTLLDGKGQPLPAGQPPVWLPYEVYPDADFEAWDFGEFVSETPIENPVKTKTYDDMIIDFTGEKSFKVSFGEGFVAPRRSRPMVKIVFSDDPTGKGRGSYNETVFNINNDEPQSEQMLLDRLTEVMSGYIEGRYGIKTTTAADKVFVDLDDVLVDCTMNRDGAESIFNILKNFVPATFLEELARRLMASYEVEITVVPDKHAGFIIQREKKTSKF